MARVSVIIPTHNRPQWLARAIQSVADQSYRDLEVVVVQNGGTRESEAVVDRFRHQVEITYYYEPQAGAAHARNIGLWHTTGSLVAFLDDDDEWLPEKLERQVAVLERYPDVGLVTCLSRIVDESGQTISEWGDVDGELSFQRLVEQGCRIPSFSSVVIRRSHLDQVGLLNPKYTITDDYDLYLRLARTCRFISLPEPLFLYRLHAGNITKHESQMWKEYIQVLRTLRPSLNHGVTQQLINAACVRIQKHHYNLATQAMHNRQYHRASRIFGDAIRLDPLVGLKLSWGRFRNPVYRALRPYVGGLWCSLAAWRNDGHRVAATP